MFHVFFLSFITLLLLSSLFPSFKSGFVDLLVQDSSQGIDKPVFELLVPLPVHSCKVNTSLILSVPQFPYLCKGNKMLSSQIVKSMQGRYCGCYYYLFIKLIIENLPPNNHCAKYLRIQQ